MLHIASCINRKEYLNVYNVCMIEFIVGKWNVYKAHISPQEICTCIVIRYDFFVFKNPIKFWGIISKFSLFLMKFR